MSRARPSAVECLDDALGILAGAVLLLNHESFGSECAACAVIHRTLALQAKAAQVRRRKAPAKRAPRAEPHVVAAS